MKQATLPQCSSFLTPYTEQLVLHPFARAPRAQSFGSKAVQGFLSIAQGAPGVPRQKRNTVILLSSQRGRRAKGKPFCALSLANSMSSVAAANVTVEYGLLKFLFHFLQSFESFHVSPRERATAAHKLLMRTVCLRPWLFGALFLKQGKTFLALLFTMRFV